MKPLLIEIGSEEIPARFIRTGLALLKENLVQLFEKHAIDYGDLKEYATPRRLTIYVDNVSEKQKDKTVESLGPPKKVAYDENGNPTKAATGFARSLNLDVSDLSVTETGRGEYLSARIEEKGRATKTVLTETLPGLISSLQLPKSMRWGDSSLKYFRPIHWILSLLGSDIVPFELFGIKSSNISYGHRFLSPVAIRISDPSSYIPLLKQNHVLADMDERKSSILDGIRAVESSHEGKVIEDAELLDTVANLVEYPSVASGNFDNKFIALPRELLITVMKSHQKYFSVEDRKGNMMPAFVVVSNTKAENNDTVREGAERVLRARLEDARFYYIEDQKKPFGDYIVELKKVTFQEKLGSLYKKAERITSLCTFMSDKFNLDIGEQLQRASMLCKADLVTGVVGEFPELQGYMGMMYASASGEDKETAYAIYEHYLPRFAGDKLPSGKAGAILSISDKMDNVASFFSLGLIPTGSEDPFALRRQASGIINILHDQEFHLPLNLLIGKSLECLVATDEERRKLADIILQFFNQRLEGMFLSKGYSHDTVNATLSLADLNITDATRRIQAITGLKNEDRFPSLLTAAKRVYNILTKFRPGEVNENLLTESSEKELFRAVLSVKDRLSSGDSGALFDLEHPINSFFDSVLVMDNDTEIRNNRLALLLAVKKSFDRIGDFSKIID